MLEDGSSFKLRCVIKRTVLHITCESSWLAQHNHPHQISGHYEQHRRHDSCGDQHNRGSAIPYRSRAAINPDRGHTIDLPKDIGHPIVG